MAKRVKPQVRKKKSRYFGEVGTCPYCEKEFKGNEDIVAMIEESGCGPCASKRRRGLIEPIPRKK